MNGFTLWHWVGIAQLFICVMGANLFFYLYNRRIKQQYHKHLAMAHEALQAMTALKDRLLAEEKSPPPAEIITNDKGLKVVPPIEYLETIQKEAELRLQELGVYSTDWDAQLDSQQQSALFRYQFAELEKSIVAAGDDTFSAWESVEIQLTAILDSLKGSGSINIESSMDVQSSISQQLMQDNALLTEELKEEKEKFQKAADYWRTKLKEVKEGYQGLLDYINQQEMEELKTQLNILYNSYIETGYLLSQNSMELLTDEAPPTNKNTIKQPDQNVAALSEGNQHFSYGEVGVLNNIIHAQLKEIEELRNAFSESQDSQTLQQTLAEKLNNLENQLRETESCVDMLEKKIKEDQDKNYIEKIQERKDRLKSEIRAKELMGLMKREHQLIINQSLPNKNKKDLVLTADRIINFVVEFGSYFGIIDTKVDSSTLLTRVIDQSAKEASAKKETVFNQPKEPAKPVLENTQVEMNKLKLVVNKQRTVINKLVERVQDLEKNEDKLQFMEEYEQNVKQLDQILKENNMCIEMLEKELNHANHSVTTLEREVEELKNLLQENKEQRKNDALKFEQEKEKLKNEKISQIQTLTETVEVEPSEPVNQAPAFNQFSTEKLTPPKEEKINFDSPYSNMGIEEENPEETLELDAMLKDIYETDKNISQNLQQK